MNAYHYSLKGALITIVLFLSMYFIVVTFLLNAPFIGVGLIGPITAGTLLGAIAGFLYFQKNSRQAYLINALEQQEILKEVALLPHQNYTLEDILDRSIKLIVKASFAKNLAKIAIFLTDKNDKLILKSHFNAPDFVINNCGVKSPHFGKCICENIIQEKHTIYKNCTDYDNSVKCVGVNQHGQYHVPILYNNKTLGVLVVFLEENHIKDNNEISFLEAAANILALLLKKFEAKTKLLENEIDLLKQQSLINGILSETPDPLYLLDLTTAEFVYCNNAMNKVLENNPDFLKNYKAKGVGYFREEVHPEDLEEYDKMNELLRKGTNSYTIKFRTHIFNKYQWIEQKMLVFSREENGYVRQVLIVTKNIHQQIIANNNVKKLNTELTDQNKEIKKMNAELDRFVYSVSHDLRGPLASIIGLVSLSELNPESDANELIDYMKKIGKSAKKLDAFIKDMLDFSRNSSAEITIEPIDLQKLVMEIVEDIQSLKKSDVEFNLYSSGDIVYIGDKRRLSIVLTNLISNAFKYADFDKPNRFLKINISSTDKGCSFTIEDNGIGINKESAKNVFNMFYRATDKAEGSGLGLYIVSEIVEKLKGSISMESEEGVGTKIFLKLPQSKDVEVNKK